MSRGAAALPVLMTLGLFSVAERPAIAAGAEPEAVISAGREELIGAILGNGVPTVGGCTLKDANIDKSVVRGVFTCDGKEAHLELRHPAHAPGAAAVTKKFALVSQDAPPSLVEAIRARAAEREGTFEWTMVKEGGSAAMQQAGAEGAAASAAKRTRMTAMVGAAVLIGLVAIVLTRRRRPG